MVFAPIRKYKYRKELERKGIPKSSPSHDIAMDFALRFPRKIEEDLFLLDGLSYQNPNEFKQELEAIWEVYQSGKRPLVTTFSALGLPFNQLEQLIRIYGPGNSAGNVLRALAGISVEHDDNAKQVYDVQSRIENQKVDDFTVPESVLTSSKSPEEFLSNYMFGLLIYSELGLQPSSYTSFHCWHVADLTRRHHNPTEYRKRLEDIMTQHSNEFFEPERRNMIIYGLPSIVIDAFPTIAFLAKNEGERDALERIRSFTQQLDASPAASNCLLEMTMHPVAICSRTTDEMQECLDTILGATREIRQAGVELFPAYFHFLRYFEDFVGSVDDFKQAMTTTQRFFIRLGASDFKFPQPDYILGDFAKSVQFRDVGEFNASMEQITGDMLQYPYDTEGGYAAETVDKIGKLSSTPQELVRNNRLYGRLANGLKSAPCIDLVKAVNEQDSTEDECVGALTRFYEKIKDTSEYQFSDYLGDSGPGKIWEQFFRANLLPKLLRVNKAGDFDVHLSLSTHTDSGYDDYMGDWTATYIDSVHLDISPRK